MESWRARQVHSLHFSHVIAFRGSRFSSENVTAYMCRMDCGGSRFPARSNWCSRHFCLHPLTPSGLDNPVSLGVWLFRSCRSYHLFLTGYCAINSHPVQKGREFAGNGNNGTPSSLCPYQTHSLLLNLRSGDRTHE